MIGIFDSGLGGLQTLHYFITQHPEYDYCFLADTDNLPYGDKQPQQIKTLTHKSLQYLFDQGCQIVIIACNTAAAYSIRDRQKNNPHKKTLSVTIPGIQKIKNNSSISIIATQATITSDIYPEIIHREKKTPTSIYSLPTPDLVPLIEQHPRDDQKIHTTLKNYFKSSEIQESQTLMLGCTHYPIIKEIIKQHRAKEIVDPGYEAAQKFTDYLSRHPNIKAHITTNQTRTYLTTGDSLLFDKKASALGFNITSQKIILPS